ncbi:methylated-DNA-[protein]-cysteine S-methyltransferase [[Luteovulum] sphaeroides subsp. megalophilum]|uniref:methylated-DNA--[protein]-cysteine S-methyltransferase n=1 Tax=Cereibacter sphaeroides TaxID=1063 RepID=UPI000B6CF206|nr:methylated-DNA--[protein]-cysteine S-methyltransferase [Cereibacter sphaeroides]SNT25164.1 methylated-DNA-[protein]-cysteine S-methyltransferase [[Luteovulum] sphaeroides subsp. megalophilum]
MKGAVLTPVGRVVLTEEDDTLVRLSWSDEEAEGESPLLAEAAAQIAAYFDRRLTRFELPLALGSGRAALFHKALLAIPFGETRRYGELARGLGIPPQAVGRACGQNPLPILVPCHRVLGATGLGGFSAPGGIETKIALLRHEGALLI